MELTLEDPKPNKRNEMALRDATDRDVPALLEVLLAAFLEYRAGPRAPVSVPY